MVVLYHFSRLFAPGETPVPHGYLAVDFFFILSGFVLDYAYGPRLAARRLGRQGFLERRLVRLAPLTLFGTLAGLGLCAGHGWVINGSDVTPWAAAQSAVLTTTFVPSRLNGVAYALNPPTWSLTFELLANMVFACVAPALTRTRLVAIVVLSGALLAAGTLMMGSVGLNMSRWPMLALALPRVAFGFFVGVLVQRVRLGRSPLGWQALAGGAVALLAVLVVPSASPLFELLAVFAILPVVVAVTSRVAVGRPLAAAGAILGRLSFPLYALHMPAMALVLDVERAFRLSLGRPFDGLLAVSLVVAAAWAIGRYLDEPMRQRLTHAMSRPAPARLVGHVEASQAGSR